MSSSSRTGRKNPTRPRSGGRRRRTTSTWARSAKRMRQLLQLRNIVEMVARTSPAQIKAVLKKVRAPPPAPPDVHKSFCNSLVATFGSRVHREAKVDGRDDHPRCEPPRISGLRELIYSIAGRAIAAVVFVRERPCNCHRRCGRCAACTAACSPSSACNAPAQPPGRQWAAYRSLSRISRTHARSPRVARRTCDPLQREVSQPLG